mmetsp:Transcript_32165/g.47303  ORF Transcript_32165/g.47303 Transcript_32165/m.47303 type:complete len:239 (-) Transcript_32165:600-1316(-)
MPSVSASSSILMASSSCSSFCASSKRPFFFNVLYCRSLRVRSWRFCSCFLRSCSRCFRMSRNVSMVRRSRLAPVPMMEKLLALDMRMWVDSCTALAACWRMREAPLMLFFTASSSEGEPNVLSNVLSMSPLSSTIACAACPNLSAALSIFSHAECASLVPYNTFVMCLTWSVNSAFKVPRAASELRFCLSDSRNDSHSASPGHFSMSWLRSTSNSSLYASKTSLFMDRKFLTVMSSSR